MVPDLENQTTQSARMVWISETKCENYGQGRSQGSVVETSLGG